MSDVSILNLTALAAASLQSDDQLAIVDVHDSTQSPGGTTKRVLLSSVFTNPTFVTSTTITGGTVTVSTPLVSATQTWNAGAVTFTALKLNVTATASAAASLLIDLQTGGVSMFSVTKAGAGTFAAALVVSAGGLTVTGNSTITGTLGGVTTLTVATGVVGSTDLALTAQTASGDIVMTTNGSERARWFRNGQLVIGHSTTSGAAAGDVVLINTGRFRGLNAAATSCRALIGLDANDVVQLGDPANSIYTSIGVATGVTASANRKSVIHADSGTAGQLVFFDGVTGARYKLTGTAF